MLAILRIILYCLSVSFLYAESHHFDEQEYKITTFPDLAYQNGKEIRTMKSYHRNISISYPIHLSPFSKIKIFAKKPRQALYINKQSSLQILSRPHKIFYKFSRFRISLTKKILHMYPNSAHFILSLVLGNRNFFPEGFLYSVQSSGLIHLFALSGLHIIICVSIFSYIFYMIGSSRRVSIVITMPIVLFYLCLGGMGISLQRASLAYFIWSIFDMIRIPLASYKIVFLTIFIHLICFPSNILSLSFILSYGSILGIVFFYEFWYDRFYVYFGNFIASSMAISVSVVLMITPVLIWHFHFVNFWSIFSSLLLIPMMPFILLTCFCAAFLSLLGVSIPFLDKILENVYILVYKVASFFSTLPVGVVYFSYPKIWSIVFIFPILFLILYMRRHHNGYR